MTGESSRKKMHRKHLPILFHVRVSGNIQSELIWVAVIAGHAQRYILYCLEKFIVHGPQKKTLQMSNILYQGFIGEVWIL